MRVACLLLLISTLASAAKSFATAADVVEVVTTGTATGRGDWDIAEDLKKLRLSERLSDETVGFLAAQGVGPETLKVIEELARKSVSRPLPAMIPAAREPVPDGKEFADAVAAVSRYVLNYVRGLPNFTCEQVTERFTNMVGTNTPTPYFDQIRFHKIDTILQTLRFTGGHDRSTLVTINNKGAKGVELSNGQSISTGEFGEDMRMVLGPGSGAILRWSHWQIIRGERTAVLEYTLGPAQTRFQISYCCVFGPHKEELQQSVISPIEGLIFAEPETGTVRRMTIHAIQLPKAFHIKDSRTLIDYAQIPIGSREYTLPTRAIIYIQTDLKLRTRNEIDFRNYKKFDAESVLVFTDSKVTYEGDTKR